MWVDVVTPVMENLTIRGNVKFRRGMGRELGIHAHNILIKGGRLEIGTSTDPWTSQADGQAFIELHGDVKVFGKGDAYAAYALKVYKRIDVRGYLGIHGEPRVAQARVANHVVPGDTSFTVSRPVDWRPGERLVLIGTAPEWGTFTPSPEHSGTGISQFATYPLDTNMMAGKMGRKGEREYLTVLSVSADGLTVTVDPSTPIAKHHTGEILQQNGVTMDVRDTVGMLDRSIEIRGGNHEIWDQISGLNVRQQQYGFTIVGLAGMEEAKEGWHPDMLGYEDFGIDRLNPGIIEIDWTHWRHAGKQWNFLCCGRESAFHQYPAVYVHMKSQPNFKMHGIVSEQPITGKLLDGYKNTDLQHNILFGTCSSPFPRTRTCVRPCARPSRIPIVRAASPSSQARRSSSAAAERMARAVNTARRAQKASTCTAGT